MTSGALRWFRWLGIGASCAFFSLLTAWSANAHEFRPALLSLRETATGHFDVRWSPAATSFGTALNTAPEFPSHCRLSADRGRLDCGRQGLVGKIDFPELADSVYSVAVRIEWAGGHETQRIVGGNAPSLSLQGAPRNADFRSLSKMAGDYLVLGVEHILLGFDHLLFVLGLVLLVRLTRRLVWTLTAFTIAHSITLGCSVSGLIRAPQAPVEAVIALSILLVAVECARGGSSLTRRAPWLVASFFGLLHGFGFAGALAETGLPPHQTLLPLVSFNVGVELGQLVAIGTFFLISVVAKALRLRPAERWELGVAYLMGSLAAFWSIQRIFAVFGSGS